MPTTENSIIVSAPVEQVFDVWSRFDRLPEFMDNLKSVQLTGDRRSHWVAKGPLGASIEWDAETTMFEPNKRIAWNSRDSGDITTSGQVTFPALDNDQTEIHVVLKYDPPAGVVGDVVEGGGEAALGEDLEGRFEHPPEVAFGVAAQRSLERVVGVHGRILRRSGGVFSLFAGTLDAKRRSRLR